MLTAIPEWFPLDLELGAGEVRLVRLDEAAYREASFLDARILPATGPGEPMPLPAFETGALALDPGREADFIFHIGHVGSTLLARLLGGHESVFSLREPAILRTLARLEAEGAAGHSPWPADALERRLVLTARTLARVWRPAQRSLVKATSFVSDIAGPLMAAFPSARAILMFTPPIAYMAAILGGPATHAELPSVSPMRRARLERRLGATIPAAGSMSAGEMAALGWACEIAALGAIAERFGERVMWLDFERFLADPEAGLARALRHLRGEAAAREAAGLLAGPDLHRYSKAPEHPFDAGTRARLLSAARREHAAEIERGVAWLNAAGGAHAPIATAARAAAAASRGAA